MGIIVNLDVSDVEILPNIEGKIFDYEDSFELEYDGLSMNFDKPKKKELTELKVVEVEFNGRRRKRRNNLF